MSYTKEQLATMNTETLQAVIMQIQGTTVATATETVTAIPTATVAPADTVTSQIAKIKTTIETLESQGAELYADEIASLKLKITNIEAEAKAEVKVIETDADNFYDKYHSELWIISAMVILHFVGLVKF